MPREKIEHKFVVVIGVTFIVHQKWIAKFAAVGKNIIEDTPSRGVFCVEIEIVVWVHVAAVEEGTLIWDVETGSHVAKE